MTDRSLALDGGGHPHIAYGEGQLYYAWHDGSTWQYETADPTPGVGLDASLALDNSGNPHISYISYTDNVNDSVKYAYKDTGGWHSETVAEAQGSWGYISSTSLALDGGGRVHISYRDSGTAGGLMYAYKDASGWQFETVQVEVAGSSNSLALDSAGHPHIAYFDSNEYELLYAYKDASGWHVEVAYDSAGLYTSLALDASDRPHISHYSNGSFDLLYSYKDNTGWHLETVDGQDGWVGRDTSLALDADGWPHISYEGEADLRHAYQDVSGWHIEVVDADQAWPWMRKAILMSAMPAITSTAVMP
jgi:hypothetical protein